MRPQFAPTCSLSPRAHRSSRRRPAWTDLSARPPGQRAASFANDWRRRHAGHL